MSNLTPKQLQRIARLKQVADQGNLAVTKHLFDIEDQIPDIVDVISRVVGEKGEKGDTGEAGRNGIDGQDGTNGENGENGINGEKGRDGRDGRDGNDGLNGKDGTDGTDGSPDNPQQIADKLNTLYEKVEPKVIKGWSDLERKVNLNANLPKDFDVRIGVSKTELKRLTDRVVALESGSTVAGVSSIVAGTNVTISPTNGLGAVTINSTATGGGSGYQAPLTGAVDGANDTFTWTTEPNVLMIDRVPTQKTSSDGTVNWTGTTSTVLTTIPLEDLFAVA